MTENRARKSAGGPRIEILVGSPRRNGNTAFLARRLAGLLEAAGAEAGLTFLYDLRIEPCRDCRACKSGRLVCPLRDGGAALGGRLEAAAAIVLATPIYWFAPTAKTKLLIDRWRPYYGSRRLSGKGGAVLLVAGSGASDTDLADEMFRRTFEALGIRCLGTAVAKAFDIGDAERDEAALDRIRELARCLAVECPPAGHGRGRRGSRTGRPGPRPGRTGKIPRREASQKCIRSPCSAVPYSQ